MVILNRVKATVYVKTDITTRISFLHYLLAEQIPVHHINGLPIPSIHQFPFQLEKDIHTHPNKA